MRCGSAGAVLIALLSFMAVLPAGADIVCADSSYCVVTFSCTFTGLYRPGETRDYLTVNPSGSGEMFASAGIALRVYVKNCSGTPLVGVPQQEILVFNSSLCICPGGNTADAATDANGCATFTGSLSAGGCATGLKVFADGVLIASVPINVNSPDLGLASPCVVDADDYGSLANNIGAKVGDSRYRVCLDWNLDGVIDISDLGIMARVFGSACH